VISSLFLTIRRIGRNYLLSQIRSHILAYYYFRALEKNFALFSKLQIFESSSHPDIARTERAAGVFVARSHHSPAEKIEINAISATFSSIFF